MQIIKRLGGYPCCHRQWKDDGHCQYLHGYDRWIEITWQGDRDQRGWVVDFGALKGLKEIFEHQFDHTVLVSEDDPFKELFLSPALDGRIWEAREMDPTMEGMALWVKDEVEAWTAEYIDEEGGDPTLRVVRVECWENEKNAAVWQEGADYASA